MTRRKFIHATAASAAVTAAGAASVAKPTPAPPAARQRTSASPAASASAAPAINAATGHVSGIPLGGLGTGSVEIRPDGYFHDWLIFNQGQWAPQQPEHERNAGPDMPLSALAFFLRTRQGQAEPQLRRLGLRSEENDLYASGWAKSVRGIEYSGAFPVATLDYLDDSLPVAITGTFFSPFIPHDARVSGAPGFHMVFTVRNTTNRRVEVSLMGRLKDPLAWGASDRRLENSITQEGGATYLTMRTKAEMERRATLGSLGLSVSGGKASWILGEFADYLSSTTRVNGRFGLSAITYLRAFREVGHLPSLPGSASPARLLMLSDEEIGALSQVAKADLWAKLTQYAVFDDLRHVAERVDASLTTTDQGLTAVLSEARSYLDSLAGDDRNRQDWGDAALCSTLTVAPGEEKEVRFTLGWHFPHHFSANGPEMGHKYEEYFQDAEEVNRFLAGHFDDQRRRTAAFSRALHDTTLGTEMATAWSSQLSTLSKSTWWTRDGKFAVWEGLGCCGFQTMDITYQGSFSIIALFPELQKGQMLMAAEFQRQDGRVAHFFTPDFLHVDNGFDRVDMNPQFVMLAARDYLWTGDKQYLLALWPHVQRAMASTALLDGDGDGLPDRNTHRNTYDGWDFSGTPAYIASLWIGALRSAAYIATELGQTDKAGEYRAILEKAAPAFDRRLWNGEYYSLLVDVNRRDDACMSDQMSGEWFTNLAGLGHGLPKERVVAALSAIAKHNFSNEMGLQNASYPANRQAHFPAHGNVNSTANWTGIEYAIASMMIDFGIFEAGMNVVRSVHDRYLRAGRFWNHVECGDHYYRAMSSWALLLAATGFKVDMPHAALTIAPPVRSKLLRAPWFASTAWGSMVVSQRRFELRCASGEMTLKTLRLPLGASQWKTRANGRPIDAKVSSADGLAVIEFAEPLRLVAGGAITAAA
ncbi:MAG TPA: GH116 family glycosyl hydrolase [Armatimonadota bacterium]